MFFLLLIIFAIIYGHYKWSFQYWKKRNVPTRNPCIPWGTVENIFLTNHCLGTYFRSEYKTAKSRGHKFVGEFLFTVPTLLLVDPKVIQHVIQKDFEYFTDRGFYFNERNDPLSANMFALDGEKWNNLRTKLTPAFTPAIIRTMLDLVVQCAVSMKNSLDYSYENDKPIEFKELTALYSTDVIGSCAFGLNCNSLSDPDAEFRRRGREIFDFSSIIRCLKMTIAFSFPNLARWLGIALFTKETNDFFSKVVQDMLKFRKENNVVRLDLFQNLMDLQNSDNEDAIREMTAGVFLFFAAGFETSSAALSFCFYELASNPDIQTKLRQEIISALRKYQGKITHDAIMDMKYMHQVVEETLRKYPPLPFLQRRCVKDYLIPGTESVIEKGIDVGVPVLGLHYDPDYFPEPNRFDPERFSDENRKNIRPFTYIPFGEGPRICIGLRFGLMQMKVGLALLLRDYKLCLNDKTAVPIQFEKYSFTLIPKTGIYLDVQKA